jgi:PAS domain S-box-containing protein
MAFGLRTQQFLFISMGVSAVLGYSAGDFYGKANLLADMIVADDAEKVKQATAKIQNGGEVTLHYRVKTAGNVIKWIHEKRSIIPSANDGQEVMLSIMKDFDPEEAQSADDALLNEKFLNSLIDSQTNFLIRFDTAGCFTFANKQFLKLLGYRRADLTGKHFTTVTLPEENEVCEKAFRNCMAHPGKIIRLADRKRAKNGDIFDTEWEFIAVTDSGGEVKEIQGVGHDVTQKLIIEKEVEQAAFKLDAFIESMNDYFFILDNDWKFVRVNKAFEKVSNQSREEILGRVIWDVFPIVLGTMFEDAYRKCAAEQVPLQFTGHAGPSDMWFDTSVYPSGEGLTVFIKDITIEKRAQEQAIRTQNSLAALINNTTDLIWSVDKETRYVHMNRAYCQQIERITGRQPAEGDYSYLHPGYTTEEIERWKEYYGRALAGERYTVISESPDLQTGQMLSFEVSFNPIYTVKDDITGVGCFSHNITERLAIEKAIVDQNERLRHIASLTSHELRRPVASMIGLINIMDRTNFFNPDNREVIEHLLTVGNEIDEVIRLIVDKTFMDVKEQGRYLTP